MVLVPVIESPDQIYPRGIGTVMSETVIHAAALFFIQWSHLWLMGLIILVGLLSPKRAIFLDLIFLLLFTLILNKVLKAAFHVPLPPALGMDGFAFPSGHMQISSIFYGGLALHLGSWRWRVPLGILLAGIGWSLTYFGYHYWIDVWGALFFASLTLGIQIGLQKRGVRRASVFLITVLASNALMAYMGIMDIKTPDHVPHWALMGLTGLLAFLRWQDSRTEQSVVAR